jgi:hypothetical protein
MGHRTVPVTRRPSFSPSGSCRSLVSEAARLIVGLEGIDPPRGQEGHETGRTRRSRCTPWEATRLPCGAAQAADEQTAARVNECGFIPHADCVLGSSEVKKAPAKRERLT